ncbi:von Willebrand factor A domain-containing protein 3A-like isoform X2 [Symsagittifera roscoffensis]|uniref:von Willebrand factor A domain-containing protein 3A-like isoform X2 n=1 Tax=Symsagittifera roscoffensis TaxID=84072 RepID=UPI00307BE8C8
MSRRSSIAEERSESRLSGISTGTRDVAVPKTQQRPGSATSIRSGRSSVSFRPQTAEKKELKRAPKTDKTDEDDTLLSKSDEKIDAESLNGSTSRSIEDQKPPKHRRNKGTSSGGRLKSEGGLAKHENAWEQGTEMGAPPPATYVTKVNHTHDLMRLATADPVAQAEFSSTEEWLSVHGIDQSGLDFKTLLNKGIVSGDTEPGRPARYIKFQARVVDAFERRLKETLAMYNNRVRWLLQASRRVFGVVQGRRVAVLIDTSDANLNFGRLASLKEDMIALFDQQISSKQAVFLIGMGSELDVLFDSPVEVTYRAIEECKAYLEEIRPGGGCNVLKALDVALSVPGVDSLLLVQGSCADQPVDKLCSFVQQMLVGRGENVNFQVVSYNCSSTVAITGMETMAQIANGRLHCHNAEDPKQAYASTDMKALLAELEKGKGVLGRIQQMRQGMIGDALINIVQEINSEVAKMPASQFLPRPPNHTGPLHIQEASFSPKTTADWLAQNGLKAKRLSLYQILAPNAFDYVEGFVAALNKNIKSSNYESQMVQFEWHDKSVKNVHVDPTMLYDYQQRLGSVVVLFEKRIDWLSTASRRIFGTIVENKVIFLIDVSELNRNYIIHIQHAFRQLLQEQMSNKVAFNIIKYGSETEMWKPRMMPPTERNLQSAWKWILGLDCGGSRNLLGAFRSALENEADKKEGQSVDALYVFTSGVPDQFKQVSCSYVSEVHQSLGVKVHTLLYNIDDNTIEGLVPGRYSNIKETADYLRDLSHAAGGRFHWFRETGVIESDDTKLLFHEIDKAVNFSEKSVILIDALRKKYPQLDVVPMQPIEGPKAKKALGPPKETKSSIARQQASRPQISDGKPASRSAGGKPNWKPAAGVNGLRDSIIPPASVSHSVNMDTGSVPAGAKRFSQNENRRSSSVRANKTSFYTDEKFSRGGEPDKGQVYGQYPTILDQKTKVRKQIKRVIIPDVEENLSSKAWMKKYGLAKLRLDLYKLVSGPDCSHDKERLPPSLGMGLGGKAVEAIYCRIFPSIQIGGAVKHLQLTLNELRDYQGELEKALKRYLKRIVWLLQGSRRVFGSIVEKRVVILIDCSGSMALQLDTVKQHLVSLIWDQLQKNNIRFNLIAFSDYVQCWKPTSNPNNLNDQLELESVSNASIFSNNRTNNRVNNNSQGSPENSYGCVEPTDQNCNDAVIWISKLKPARNTCTLEALKEAYKDPEVEGLYLLTDGKPDSSCSLVLKEVSKWRFERENNASNMELKASKRAKIAPAIHTISFNCSDNVANTFLSQLAQDNRGRFHAFQTSDLTAQKFVHSLTKEETEKSDYAKILVPKFDSDDLNRVASEVSMAIQFLLQSQAFTDLYSHTPKPHETFSVSKIKQMTLEEEAMSQTSTYR